MALRIQITKSKFHHYQLRVNSPNLMLTKVTHYMVHVYLSRPSMQAGANLGDHLNRFSSYDMHRQISR